MFTKTQYFLRKPQKPVLGGGGMVIFEVNGKSNDQTEHKFLNGK